MLRTLPYNSADPRRGIKADLSDREEYLLRQILFATILTSTAAWAQEPSVQTAPTELLNGRIQKLILHPQSQ
jgi:hypothetical protein